MSVIEFQAWPKIARLNRDMVVTEKIDGTNAAVIIEPASEYHGGFRLVGGVGTGEDYAIGAQSRNRLITPESDNFGFARWVDENAVALVDALGPGRHFGEWWGSGIQRGYGLQKGEKRFSLFNTKKWAGVDLSTVAGLGVVPVLYQGPFDPIRVDFQLLDLEEGGSRAAYGFMNPEGVVVYHVAANQLFKVTIENDAAPKGVAA